MVDCSVIFTAANEYPKICFAVQSVITELEGRFSYEVVVVDNLSTDETEGHFSKIREKRIKYLKYDKKQSHWNAKNHGIENSKGKYVFFLDAHALIGRDSLKNMIEFLEGFDGQIGAVHSYHNTINVMKGYEYELKKGKFAYRFMTGQNILTNKTEPYQIGVATTDGMLVPRKVFDKLGTWHPEFGVRAGGEAYMNFKHSTCGYPHYMHPKANFYHFKAKGYKYPHNYSDWARNNFICTYTVGGKKWLDFMYDQYVRRGKVKKPTADRFYAEIIDRCEEERKFIESNQIMTLDEYFDKWETQKVLAEERKKF